MAFVAWESSTSRKHGPAFLVLPGRGAHAVLQFMLDFTDHAYTQCWRSAQLFCASLLMTVTSTDLNFVLIFDSLGAVKCIFCKEIMFSEIIWLWKLLMVTHTFATRFTLPLLLSISNSALEKIPWARRVGAAAHFSPHLYLTCSSLG